MSWVSMKYHVYLKNTGLLFNDWGIAAYFSPIDPYPFGERFNGVWNVQAVWITCSQIKYG